MKGFTLIEMLVSVAIFSVVMVIALGALLSISVSDRKAETLKSVINNLNFSLDSMSRAMRTGTSWNCITSGGHDCATGGNFIAFVPSTGVGHVYYKLESLVNDPANAQALCSQTSPNVGCILRSTDDGATWAPITAPEVVITDCSGSGGCNGSASPSYLFYVVGSLQGAADPTTAQPKLNITLTGYVRLSAGATSQATCNTAGNQCSVFHLQATVEQRLYDQ